MLSASRSVQAPTSWSLTDFCWAFAPPGNIASPTTSAEMPTMFPRFMVLLRYAFHPRSRRSVPHFLARRIGRRDFPYSEIGFNRVANRTHGAVSRLCHVQDRVALTTGIEEGHIPTELENGSSPGLSRRPRTLGHRATTIGVAGTSPTTTLDALQHDRNPV